MLSRVLVKHWLSKLYVKENSTVSIKVQMDWHNNDHYHYHEICHSSSTDFNERIQLPSQPITSQKQEATTTQGYTSAEKVISTPPTTVNSKCNCLNSTHSPPSIQQRQTLTNMPSNKLCRPKWNRLPFPINQAWQKPNVRSELPHWRCMA